VIFKKTASTLITIIFFVIASWFLIHFFALLGVYISLIFPILYLIYPKMTICLGCESRNKSGWCIFCRTKISKKEAFPQPKGLRSAVLNSVVILIFSVVCIGIVFMESKLIFKTKPNVLGESTRVSVTTPLALDENVKPTISFTVDPTALLASSLPNLRPAKLIEGFDAYVVSKWTWVLDLLDKISQQVSKTSD